MPTLASTSRAQLRRIVESVFGTTPVSGNPKNVRMTGESLGYQIGTERSKEIRSDRQVTDLIQTSAQANGGVNFELSYNEYDDLMESVLQGTWAAYGTAGVGTTFTGTFTATTIVPTVNPSGSSAFTNLAKGQWFRLLAPSHANDGLILKVSESVTPTAALITLDAATPLATGTSIAGCAIQTSRLTNGTTQRSWTLEREFGDISQFMAFKGMVASKMSLNMASGAIVAGSFDFMGKNSTRAASTQLPGTAVASLTYDVANAVTGVGQIMEGTTLLTGTFIKSMNFSVDNKLRIQDAIGTLGAAGIGSGSAEITGTIEVYLADGTMYDKFVNNTTTKLSVRVVDGSGNGYVFSFPKVKFSDAKVNAGAIDQDAMISMPFTALMDATTGKTILVDRVGVAVV